MDSLSKFAQDTEPVRREPASGRRTARTVLQVCLLLFTPVLALGVQLAAVTDGWIKPVLEEHVPYLALNTLCTVIVTLLAQQAHGQISLRLTRTLNAAFLVHGCLAFAVLVMRMPFSRSAMLAGLIVSLVAAVLIIFVRETRAGPRVGAIQGRTEALPLSNVETIMSPEQDLRQYDVLLTPMSTPLSAEWSAAVSRAMLTGTQLRHAAEYLEEARGQTSVRHFHVDHLSDNAGQYAWIKRTFDLVLIIAVLPVAAPLMLITALMVLVLMGRPVLFVQERVGLGGRVFRMFKFRTMAPNRASTTSATAVGDMRVTSLGRILRRYRLDELPQFLNVAAGEMSLIGPRPEQPSLQADYVRQEPAFAYRNLVRPGITGWAQIHSGYASNLEESRLKLSYDLYYVKNISLGLDLQIALRTIWTLLSGHGAR